MMGSNHLIDEKHVIGSEITNIERAGSHACVVGVTFDVCNVKSGLAQAIVQALEVVAVLADVTGAFAGIQFHQDALKELRKAPAFDYEVEESLLQPFVCRATAFITHFPSFDRLAKMPPRLVVVFFCFSVKNPQIMH
jgi:hypothetical protein